jgi:hypothetical protein
MIGSKPDSVGKLTSIKTSDSEEKDFVVRIKNTASHHCIIWDC